MATTPEGIMALNQPQGAAPQISYEEGYDVMRQALQQARPDLDLEMQEMLDEATGDLSELSNAELQKLIAAIQQLYDDPENYAQNIAQAVQEGDLDQDDFPAEYNEEFLAIVLTILREEQRKRTMAASATAPMEARLPQQFARGGIAEAARLVANQGRYGDTMLAHITPEEARLLKARGGAGTINPATGLPEFFIGGILRGIGRAVKSVVKTVVNVAKKVVSNPIGRIVATVALGAVLAPAIAAIAPSLATATGALTATGTAITGAIASGGVTALSGGSLKDVLVSAASGFIGAPGGPVSNVIGKYTGQFITNPIVRDAVAGAVVGTGAGLVTGQNLKQALQSGLVQGAVAGGSSYMQNRSITQANNAAKAAATDVAENAVQKAATGQRVQPTPLDIETVDVPVDTKLRDLPGGNQIAEKTYSSGKVTSQTVSGTGSPISPEITIRPPSPPTYQGPPTNLAAAAPSAAATTAIDAQRLAAVSPAPPPLDLDLEKANVISRGMATTPDTTALARRTIAQTPGPVAAAPMPVDTSDAFSELTSVTPRPRAISGVPSTISTGEYRYTGGPPSSAAATNVSGGAPYQTAGVSEVAPPYQAGGPGVMASLKKIGQGDITEGLGDLFFPSGPTPEQVAAVEAKYGAGTAASKAALAPPTMLRSYGPMATAGIAGLAMAGGFEPKQVPLDEQTQEFKDRMLEGGSSLLEKDPSSYYIQNLPGVTYGPEGQITGSMPYESSLTLADIRNRDPYFDLYNYQYRPSAYLQQPINMSMGGLTTAQDATRQPSYMFMGSPQYMNTGGIAALTRGGYPRRVGQISGPGTEKSDSIPAMLSDGEFVMTARAVRGMGNGSRREGAKRMYALMHKLEKNAARG